MQKIINAYGCIGRELAYKWVRKGKSRIAYWRQNKKRICRMQNINGHVTWQDNVGNQWWSATKTLINKFGIV